MKTEHLLAAYGTLRPGEINHRLLADVPGEWLDGWVRGYVGEEDGYPEFWYSPGGARQPVKVFHSAELPGIWSHLDWFEGKNWPRTVVPVELAEGGTVQANPVPEGGLSPLNLIRQSLRMEARAAAARQASEPLIKRLAELKSFHHSRQSGPKAFARYNGSGHLPEKTARCDN